MLSSLAGVPTSDIICKTWCPSMCGGVFPPETLRSCGVHTIQRRKRWPISVQYKVALQWTERFSLFSTRQQMTPSGAAFLTARLKTRVIPSSPGVHVELDRVKSNHRQKELQNLTSIYHISQRMFLRFYLRDQGDYSVTKQIIIIIGIFLEQEIIIARQGFQGTFC